MSELQGFRDEIAREKDNYLREIERLQHHIDLAFHAACGGDARTARQHLTDARWGVPVQGESR